MKKFLFVFLISCFSLTVISCSDEKEEYSATGTTDNTTTTSESVKFVAVGDSGTILTSTDGTSWTSRTSGTTSNLVGVTYGNSKFLTLTGSMDNGTYSTATVLTSSDGTSWTSSSATCSTCENITFSTSDDTYAE